MSPAKVESAIPERKILMNLTVNGEPREAPNPRRNLLSYLRYDLGLTGTKYGCGEGLCGACTVLVDGQPLKSCMSTVGAVAGGSITTVEGVATDGALNRVQQAFIDESAMQCGYCIPGFIMATIGLLDRDPRPSRDTVRQALAGNLCRCGTYLRIERAVMRAAAETS
jgi:aerobic-type carbon monoxide dehydrogenase small subunit (CoxS/CutS family)